ncbi:hypothetical protein KS083_26300 [Klebsiella pneumoniae subsp. ozaenae]|nr:hypothetical protein [Klebsiella pneumoniae subsp. ozaenae]
MIPARVTEPLASRCQRASLQVILVNHVSHANEIDGELRAAVAMRRQAGVTLLNESVLLRGVNENAQTMADLSNELFDAGEMPYYLHVMDGVKWV